MLYYPLVHPPKRTLFEAILYWDGLSSLVPMAHGSTASYHYSDELAILRDVDLFHGVSLEGILQDTQIEEILDVVESLERFAPPGTLEIPDELSTYTRLWGGKLPFVLEDELLHRGLLALQTGDYGVLRGNPRVLLAVLSCAADHASSILESRTGDRFVPVTTNRFAHECATMPLSESQSRMSWMADVGAVLPVPHSDTPLADVLAFRERYTDERQRCIRAVRELQSRLRFEISNPTEVVSEFRRELGEAVADIHAAGKTSLRWGATRAVWTLIATAAGTASASSFSEASPVIVGLAGVAGGLAINLATAQARVRDDSFVYLRQLEDRFPFAHLT